MTFDIYLKNKPEGVVLEVAGLLEQAMVLSGPDRERVFDQMREKQGTYRFGCNNWFMDRLTRALKGLNMVDREFAHSGFTGNAEQDEMVVKEFDEVTGLPPVYKFGSNDGWLVSPAEIRAALALYDSYPDGMRRLALVLALEDRADYIARWVEFIEFWRVAEQHGGFEVY